MNMISIEPVDDAVKRLSCRQIECLNLASAGRTSKDIARQIGISPSTVDNHIRSAIERLGARNRTDAIRMLLNGTPPSDSPSNVPPLPPISEIQHQDALPLSVSRFPPIGGQINTLPLGRRLTMVFQITIASIMAGAGAIVTISGVVHLLG